MTLQKNEKVCGECTKCCDGWFSGNIQGHSFGSINGKIIPCNFVIEGNGCSIYENRPKSPCRNYKCEWLRNTEMPNNFRPDLSNVIISRRGFSYYVVTKAGKDINQDVIDWIENYCNKNGFKVSYE
jgi:hypothetical protein